MDYEQLKNELATQRGQIRRRLMQLIGYAMSHPNDIVLENIAVISKRAEAPPSSLIRYGKSFVFSDFSEMQKVFPKDWSTA